MGQGAGARLGVEPRIGVHCDALGRAGRRNRPSRDGNGSPTHRAGLGHPVGANVTRTAVGARSAPTSSTSPGPATDVVTA